MLPVFVVVLIIFHRADSHSHGAYSHDSDIGGGNENWMKYLYADDKISTLSLPGTHDTMADDNDGDLVDCQSLTLTKQLNAGIRVLDIRAKISSNKFVMFHGPYYLSANFDDVLTDIKNFLNAHPTEFILMRVKEEADCCDDTTFANIFASYYDSVTYRDYFYKPSSNTAVPKVSDVRKKIVVLQDFVSPTVYGLNYGDVNVFNIQDNYALCQQSDLYNKWLNVKWHLDTANREKSTTKFHINYLSGSMEKAGCALVFPYFVASGHSSSGTSASRLSTGLTTPAFSGSYPDFPRTTCTGNWLCVWLCDDICTISYEGTNILAYDYMNPMSFVGIMMIDFPGKALIDRIISKNRYMNPYNYIGCYKDTSARALRYGPQNYGYTVDTCFTACVNYKYFALQNGGWCCCDNDRLHAQKYGEAANCPANQLGGAWANNLFDNAAAYSTIQIGNKCLDVSGWGTTYGSNIIFWDCHGGDNQLWKYENGMIIGKHSGKCVDVHAGGTSNGVNIQLWGCWGGLNQKWTYNIGRELVSQQSGKCLDVAGMSNNNGANIHLWECHGGWNQQWTFESAQ